MMMTACTSPQELKTSIVVYRFDPPAFLEYSEDLNLTKEIPFSIPSSCGLNNTFAPSQGKYLLIELNCPNGQTVLFLDVESAAVSQPVTDSDSHFLSWASDGKSAYLKVDSLGSPKVLRMYPDGKSESVPITEFTYDLSAHPLSSDFTFSFSRGLGYGSEIYLAGRNGQTSQLLYADLFNYISFARFSPDGTRIAFIKTPDTQTPFTVGELWVIPSSVTFSEKTPSSMEQSKFVTYLDAGHGYASNWSADGKWIAYVKRENPDDESANRSTDALISNIYLVDPMTGESIRVTDLSTGRVETPTWSPLGNTLAFNVVINGRMTVFIADITSGEVMPLGTESSCCPAWMRK